MAKQIRVQAVTYNPSVSTEECGEDVVYANTGDFTVDEMPATSVALKTEEQNKKTFSIPLSIPPFVPPVAVCWGILLLIMGLRIHFTAVLSTKLRNQMEVSANFEEYLRHVISNLISTEENFERNHSKLKHELDEMTQAHNVLETNLTELRRENQQLKDENQQLKEENQQLKEENQRLKENNLKHTTTQIPWETSPYTEYVENITSFHSTYKREIRTKEMLKGTRGLNESSPVWSDYKNLLVTMAATLPRRKPCQTSWLHFLSSCYSISNRESPRKTWEEARDDCRGKDADLVVVESPEEQVFIFNSSLVSLEVDGFWIGLRVEENDWTWVNGSHLTEDYWIHRPADDHHCAISVKEPSGWKAVSCDVKRGWICEKSALSV